jgi:dihydrofolate synthase / folylpolyglutamate synthase
MHRPPGRSDGLVRFATLQEWLGWQEQLHPRSIDLDLERVRRVADRLRLRTSDRPVITVGGTNGKGSCVAFLESLLAAGEYRVGTFTSPHLVRYNERIRLAGREATDGELIGAFERIDEARGDTSLTFFEFNALAALFLFQQERFDALVLEVGLGGRLDAVNIVDPDVAVLTSVGLDHCDWLGTTLEAIGREKAGIFRAGRPAVLGSRDMPKSVYESARTLCAALRVPGVDYGFSLDGPLWHWQGREHSLPNLPLPSLHGQQQVANAATALAALAELRARLPLSSDHVATGLRQARLRGRFEVVHGNPEWILDVAHNAAAAEVLAQGLRDFPRGGRTLAIVGILADKDAAGVVRPLQPEVDTWIATSLAGARGTTAAELKERVGEAAQHWHEAGNVPEACELAMNLAAPADRIVVLGSFHTVGPAIEWLARMPLSSAILARPQFG